MITPTAVRQPPRQLYFKRVIDRHGSSEKADSLRLHFTGVAFIVDEHVLLTQHQLCCPIDISVDNPLIEVHEFEPIRRKQLSAEALGKFNRNGKTQLVRLRPASRSRMEAGARSGRSRL